MQAPILNDVCDLALILPIFHVLSVSVQKQRQAERVVCLAWMSNVKFWLGQHYSIGPHR